MDGESGTRGRTRCAWVWAVMALVAGVAVWHAVDFESDLDGEFPAVVRPTYGAFPPAAYRLAEPGDTLDRVTLYLASALVVGTAVGLVGSKPGLRAGWAAVLAGSIGLWWYAATPGPSLDGWFTLGWRAILDPRAPAWMRAGLAGAMAALVGVFTLGLFTIRQGWVSSNSMASGRGRTMRALLATAAVLLIFRLVDLPAAEPAGYWSRWAGVLAGLAGVLAMGLAAAGAGPGVGRLRRVATGALGVGVAWCLIHAGLGLIEYHRPIPRLKEAVAGRIYISAMPDYRGLELAQGRHHFRTIINLFDEDGPQRSRLWPQELAFVRDHPEIRYLRSPGGEADDGAFLDETLAVVQDPTAWPVLVHCHGCMDRTPAWLGIYRFVVEGGSLTDVFREIEAHRGYRPKASVTLLYHHVLPRLAPTQYAADPVSGRIAEAVRGVPDPYARERGVAGVCPPAAEITARRQGDGGLQ